MKKVSRLVAVTLVLAMTFASTVFAASSPSTGSTTTTTDTTPAAAYTESVQAQLAAPAAVYSGGIETAAVGGTAVAVAPLTVAAVNYATLGAKLLVGPTATVLKAFAVAPAAGTASSTITLSIPGIVKGQDIVVIAYDPVTGTWVKIKGVKVRNGKISFSMGKYTTFSLVSNTVAP